MTSKPSAAKRERIRAELREHGAVWYDLRLPEAGYLPQFLHDDEHVMGSVFGKYPSGKAALIATDQRVIFLDKKPLFLHCDEIGYLMITGISYTHAGLYGLVTLHTRLDNFALRTMNQKNAYNFVDYIESACLQNPNFTYTDYDKAT